MIKPKQVKYIVTGPFGLVPVGTMISALLIVEGEGGCDGLLYHPGTPDECPSLEFGKYDSDEKVWVSADPMHYLNLSEIPRVARAFEQKLFGKDFKPKRIVHTPPKRVEALSTIESIKSKLTPTELRFLKLTEK